MSSAWFLVLDGSGECVSIGQQVADPLPAGLRARAISDIQAERLLDGACRWDATSKSFVDLPPPLPEVTPDQIRAWMAQMLGMTEGDIDDAFREASVM